MGWKPGQGVGSRLTKKEKRKIRQRNEKLKLAQENSEVMASNSEDSDDDSTNITFAPDDYEPFTCKPKDNYFGIGYSGLDRRKILSSHINLFDTPAFCIQDKNKKLSIRGQAFGVGAFEADDENIYEKEDMSRYDFALGPERKTKTRWSQDGGSSSSQPNCLEGFVRAKERLESKKVFKPPELPKDFTPMHVVRKSRFYPPIAAPMETNKRREPLNAMDRARILEDPNDHSNKPPSTMSVASNIISKTLNLHGKQQVEERKKLQSQQSATSNSWLDKLNAQNFIKGGVVGSEQSGSLKTLESFKESVSAVEQSDTDKSARNDDLSSKSETNKLFLSDPDKQKRFEQYLTFLKNDESNKLESIQPLSMTEWDRDQERTEFEQAAKLARSNNYMADTFVHSADSVDKADPEKDKKEAVRLKMFGKLTRKRSEWKPASIVCKRFNIPEPKVGCATVETERKSAKFSVFDSLDWCNSSKFTKATDKTQIEEIPQTSKKSEENTNKEIPNAYTDGIPNVYQISEPVSEKFRIFEVSYEKVFGKGIQSTSSVMSKDIVQDVGDDNELKNERDQEAENKQATSKEPESALKDQSEEKKDLFKAIFLSSSEDSDSESEEKVDSETLKSVLIGIKDPKEINTQRNTSPPRGIFAKVDLDSLVTQPKRVNDENNTSKISETNLSTSDSSSQNVATNCENNDNTTAIPPDMYGPVLPERLLKQDSVATTTEEPGGTNQSLKPIFRSIVVSKITEDTRLGGKWVERDITKKSKKEKKKHKHKDHKSPKHKKKSKKEKRSKH